MTTELKVLQIGIASRQQMQARTMAIARGEYKPAADEPKVWFTSFDSLAQVLSTRNQHLLELIRRGGPIWRRPKRTRSSGKKKRRGF